LNRRRFLILLGAWGTLLAVSVPVVALSTRIPDEPPLPDAARSWAFAALGAGVRGAPPPTAPDAALDLPEGVVIVDAWSAGRRRHRVVSDRGLVPAVQSWIQTAPAPPELASGAAPPRFVITLVDGEGSLLEGIPFLSQIEVVPVREGLVGRIGPRVAYETPTDLQAAGAYDGAVETPIPDFSFGMDLPAARGRLADALDASSPDALTLRRFRGRTVTERPYPARSVAVAPAPLRRAALEGARFLLRHQRPDGRTTYRYDARRDRRSRRVHLARHAGSTWFLAQAATRLGDPGARAGALAGLHWIGRRATRRCGGEDRRCVASGQRGVVGPTALTALAAAELLAGGPDAAVEEQLRGLTAFLRAQQRPDGELMHVYDLARDAPVDEQHMFESGEAALALLRAHDVLGDPRDLQAAERLLGHLTGAGWRFFGSRYYYGTEHWTCLSVGAAWSRVRSPEGLDFCRRWAAWNAALQYRGGDSPWQVAGGYGVGPLFVPRITHAATNAEGMISIYEVLAAEGRPDPALARTIEETLRFILRWRFAPGPIHLFRDPEAAFGGIPQSPASSLVRNDFVQHASSALLRWADVLDDRSRRAE